MATIRSSAGNATTSLFGVVTTTANTLNSSINSVGRLASAMEAKSDAYATSIEAKAALDKLDATQVAAQNWAVQQQEKMLELNDRIKSKELYDAYLEKARKALNIT